MIPRRADWRNRRGERVIGDGAPEASAVFGRRVLAECVRDVERSGKYEHRSGLMCSGKRKSMSAVPPKRKILEPAKVKRRPPMSCGEALGKKTLGWKSWKLSSRTNWMP